MTGGMSGDKNYLGFGFPEVKRRIFADLLVDAGDAVTVIRWTDDGTPGRRLDFKIAAGVVPMVMGIQDMADGPAPHLGGFQGTGGNGGINNADEPRYGFTQQVGIIIGEQRDLNNLKRHPGFYLPALMA